MAKSVDNFCPKLLNAYDHKHCHKQSLLCNKFPAKLVYNSKILFSSTSPTLQKSAEEDCCPDVDFSQIFKTFPIACGFDRKCLRSILCAYISKPRHYCQIFTKHCKGEKTVWDVNTSELYLDK